MFLSQESHSSWAREETGGGRGWSGRKDLANDRTQRAISEGIPSKGVGRKKRVLIE